MGTCLLPVVPAVPTFFRRFSDDFTASPFVGRRARSPYCGGRYGTGARMIRAFRCTLQGAAGGSGMPTLVCSCRDMRRGVVQYVREECVLSSSLKPEWVGHDAMMISLEYREFVASLSGLRFGGLDTSTDEDTRNRMISVWDSTHSKRKFYSSTRLTAIRRTNELYRRHV